MTYAVKTEKGYNGWVAETDLEMGPVAATDSEPAGLRVLNISTSKRRAGQITSFANVYVLRRITYPNGEGYTSRTTEIFGDYSKHFNPTLCKTVTEKAIREAHAKALESAETLLAEAKAKYAGEVQP
jgi:hypothetical protein